MIFKSLLIICTCYISQVSFYLKQSPFLPCGCLVKVTGFIECHMLDSPGCALLMFCNLQLHPPYGPRLEIECKDLNKCVLLFFCMNISQIVLCASPYIIPELI